MGKNLKNYYKVKVSKAGKCIQKRHIHHPGEPEKNPEADGQSRGNRNTKRRASLGLGQQISSVHTKTNEPQPKAHTFYEN